MIKSIGFISLLTLTACISPDRVERVAANDAAIFENPCESPSRKICAFINSPVPLRPEPVRLFARQNTFFPTAEQLEFIDSLGRRWVAPVSTLTDGASIPQIFVPMIGFPNSPEFMNAAAMHDAYCGIGNEKGSNYHNSTWQKTHRMFYDALRVGGTSAIKAKIMFAAVYLGGPRWVGSRSDRLTPNTRARRLIRRSHQNVALLKSGITKTELRRLFAQVKSYIEANNPSIQELESYMAVNEEQSLATAFSQNDPPVALPPPAPYYPPYAPYPGP